MPGFLVVSKGRSTPRLRSLFSRRMTFFYLFFKVIENHPNTQNLCPMAPQGLQNPPKMVPESSKISTQRPHLWKMGPSVLRQPYGGLAIFYRFRGSRGARNRYKNLTPYTTHPRCSKNHSRICFFHLGPKMSQNSAPGRGGITHFFAPFPPLGSQGSPGFKKDAKMTPQAPKMTPRGPPGTNKHAQSFPKRTPRSPEFNLHCSK